RKARRQAGVPRRHAGDPAQQRGQAGDAARTPGPLWRTGRRSTAAGFRGRAAARRGRAVRRAEHRRRRAAPLRSARGPRGARTGARPSRPERHRRGRRDKPGVSRLRRRSVPRDHRGDRFRLGHESRVRSYPAVQAVQLVEARRPRHRRLRGARAGPRDGREAGGRIPRGAGHPLPDPPACRGRGRAHSHDPIEHIRGGMMAEVKPKLLVVEDDAGLQAQLKWAYDDFEVVLAGDRSSAIAALRAEVPAVVTLDLGLPPDPDGTSEGFAVLDELMALRRETKVIVASGPGGRESALTAIERGAYDFYQKPVDIEQLGLIVRRAFNLHEIEIENRRLAEQAGEDHRVLGNLIT